MRVPASKLHRPRLGGSVIDRTFLFERPMDPRGADLADERDAGSGESPVTLLSAPAGTGKTTLMASWAANRAGAGARVAWLSLDRTDNDRSLFWSGLFAAVRGAGTTPASGALLPDDDEVPVGDVPMRMPLVRLERVLGSSPAPLWLFLDDVQEVSAPEVLADLDGLLRRPPAGLLPVLASRRDPSVGLHRLRLEGRLREIRDVDLALDRSEVQQILRHHGVVLEEPELDLLTERTEGWAAGVRLAARSLAEVADPRTAVHQFAGDDRAVSDYLATEVLARLDGRERRLLRLCAVPEQLRTDLAVAVTGDPAAPDVLEKLYRDNVLVVRLAQPGGGYRMHTLLRSYLLAEGARADPDALSLAHRRAARWFADKGYPVWGIDHAVQAGDDGLVVELITTYGPALLAEGRVRELRRLIEVSGAKVRADPGIARLDVLAELELDPTPARPPRPRLPAGVEEVPLRERSAAWGPLEALVALQQARADLGFSAAVLEATASVHGEGEDLELLLALHRGILLVHAGRTDEAEDALLAAQGRAASAGNGHVLIRALAYRSALAPARGRWDEAWDLADETVRTALRFGALHVADVAGAVLLAAHSARQRLDHVAARRLAEEAGALLGDRSDGDIRMPLGALVAVLDVEEGGDPLDATRRLRDCWNLVPETAVSPLFTAYLVFVEHRCAWLCGRLDWARDALVRAEVALGRGGELDVLTATEHVARGRLDAARHRLAPVLDGTAHCLLPQTLQQGWLLEAVVAAAAGQPPRSYAALHEALILADETHALRAFLDLPGIPALLDENVGRFGRLDPLVERIRAAAGTRADHLVVSMTPRELSLLTDLPAQLTFEEIAARHQVSVNTVKTHVRSIYQKLGASSRRDAVATARRRGLL